MNEIQKNSVIDEERARAFSRYEKLIIKRDQLEKEAEICEMLYYNEFGELSVDLFHKKIECISWKKIISYCQAAANTGQAVREDELDTYIGNSMEECQEQLKNLIDMKNESENIRTSPIYIVEKSKRKYREIARMIHPDLHPEFADSTYFRNLWEAAAGAYRRNDLTRLEEIETLARAALLRRGGAADLPELSNIKDRISAVQNDINRITSTDPYLYKFLLDDPDAAADRKKDLETDLGEYTSYGLMLEGVLTEMMGREFVNAWKMKMQMD